ncbi:MAG: 3-hydroxyisobutyrate dehydrogenase [Alphaproteobacteria bacterium]|nr:3-hydroxyisobutyrate dehydrogenase [Alphaproteobacteria bacterium]
MANIGFIGLGNMGLPMALNLLKAGHTVQGFDLVADAVAKLAASGGSNAGSAAGAVDGAEVVVTMLPAGRHVRQVYEDAVIGRARKGALLIDSSTIDVDTARAVAADAEAAGLDMLDAPVSGGTAGAAAGTLTFMVGGSDAAFARAAPVLQAMGKTLVHAGPSGSGQAAKVCNNMMLAISMIGVSEAFVMAEKLGLDTRKLFDISSTATGQSWAMTSYCPVPGLVPAAPSNRDFKPGFTAAMMLKDLDLAQDAAESSKATTPLGAHAARLFRDYVESGSGDLDFSGIINMIRGS